MNTQGTLNRPFSIITMSVVYAQSARQFLALALLASVAAIWAGPARANVYDWAGTSGANMSGTPANWGGTVPTATDVARWNAASYLNAPTANANMTNGEVLFDAGNTAGVTFGTGASTLTLNGISGVGIQLNNGSGPVGTGSAKFALGASQSWVNNSGNILTVGGTINLSTYIFTVDGTGSTALGGIISGGAGLVKSGNGTVTLSGANTFTATMSINAGKLAMSAGSLATTNITVAAAATFDVSALASGYSVPNGKTLACGSTSGAAAINATGKVLTLASGALLSFQANGTVGQINVTGDLTLNANAITVNVTGSALAPGTYRLMDCSGTLSNTGVFGVPAITGTPLGAGNMATIRVTVGSGGYVDLVVGYSRFLGGNYDGFDTLSVTNQGVPQPILTVVGTNGVALVDGDAALVVKGTAFGTCVTNVALTNWFVVTNSGVADLSILTPVKTGDGKDHFSFGGMPTNLLAGAVSNFWISFAPSAVGQQTALVSIANSSTTTPFRINIKGEGTGSALSPGKIGLSPESLDFTATYLGAAPSIKVFSVINEGQSSFEYTNRLAYAAGADGWLTVNAPSGSVVATDSQTHTAQVSSIAGLLPGTYHATNLVSSSEATNSPQALVVTLTVAKATPSITWANPETITYGTALGETQLNANPSVPGSLAYTPTNGTFLNPGTNQILQVVLTTDDPYYNCATSQVAISVNPVIVAAAGMSGTIAPNGTVVVPFGGSTNFVVTVSDSRYQICSVLSNGVAVNAAIGLQVFTSQWHNVTGVGSITAVFDENRFVGGDYDGYGQSSGFNQRVFIGIGSIYIIR